MTNQMSRVANRIKAGRLCNQDLRNEIDKLSELCDAMEKALDAMGVRSAEDEAKSEYAGRGQKLQDKEIPDGIKPTLVGDK